MTLPTEAHSPTLSGSLCLTGPGKLRLANTQSASGLDIQPFFLCSACHTLRLFFSAHCYVCLFGPMTLMLCGLQGQTCAQNFHAL